MSLFLLFVATELGAKFLAGMRGENFVEKPRFSGGAIFGGEDFDDVTMLEFSV